MLNQVILVGRLVKDPEVQKAKNGNSYSHITLAVPRSYKNINGVYETDFIDCTLWSIIAKNTAEYVKKGEIVGVKGRIESRMYEDSEGNTKYTTEIIAEKVSFLPNPIKEDK